jgi:hypothetical protein
LTVLGGRQFRGEILTDCLNPSQESKAEAAGHPGDSSNQNAIQAHRQGPHKAEPSRRETLIEMIPASGMRLYPDGND